MSTKHEATILSKWMSKGRGLKEPPAPEDILHNLDQPEKAPANSDGVEQLNLKVPTGTKLRLRKIALELSAREGRHVSMLTIFKRMLDEYEARHLKHTDK